MKKINILFEILILIFISCNVNAFGVASPFASDSPIVVAPGESKDLVFSIQNGAGATEDITAKIEILEGKEIATVEKKEYFVPKNKEVPATVRVTIPSNVGPGYNGYVKLSVKAIPSTKTGAVSMGYGITTDFLVVTTAPIKVEKISETKVVGETAGYTNFLFALVFVVIVGIIIYLVEKRKDNKKKK